MAENMLVVVQAGKPKVMDVLSKTIRNFDIIAVQEIRDTSQTALPALRNSVNDMAGSKYDFVMIVLLIVFLFILFIIFSVL